MLMKKRENELAKFIENLPTENMLDNDSAYLFKADMLGGLGNNERCTNISKICAGSINKKGCSNSGHCDNTSNTGGCINTDIEEKPVNFSNC